MDLRRLLLTFGIALVVLGLAWPWLSKLGLGRLPGDLVIRRENFTLYVPITTCVVVSLVLTLVLWLLKR
jgi:hypothetical protein